MSVDPGTLLNNTLSNLGGAVNDTIHHLPGEQKKIGGNGKAKAGGGGDRPGGPDKTQPLPPAGGETTSFTRIPIGGGGGGGGGGHRPTSTSATTTNSVVPPPISPAAPPTSSTPTPTTAPGNPGGGGGGGNTSTPGSSPGGGSGTTTADKGGASNAGGGNSNAASKSGGGELVTQTHVVTITATNADGSLTTFTSETPIVTLISAPSTLAAGSSSHTGGIVAGVAIALIALSAIFFFFYRRNRRSRGLSVLPVLTRGRPRPNSRQGLVGDDDGNRRDSASWHRRSVGFTDIWYESRAGTPEQVARPSAPEPQMQETTTPHGLTAMASLGSLRESVASLNTVDFASWIRRSRGELGSGSDDVHRDVEAVSIVETIESYEGNPAHLNPFLSASEAYSQTAREITHDPFSDPDSASNSDINTLAGEGPLYTVMEETEPPESIRQTLRSSTSSHGTIRSYGGTDVGSITPRSSIAETNRSSITRLSTSSTRPRDSAIIESPRDGSFRPVSGDFGKRKPVPRLSSLPSPTDEKNKNWQVPLVKAVTKNKY